jgi:hypothetical protein
MYSTTRQYAAHQSDRRQARSQLLAGWLIDEPAGSLLCRRCVPAVYAKKACKSLGIKAGGIEISCKPFAGPGGPLTLAKFKTEVRFPRHSRLTRKAQFSRASRIAPSRKSWLLAPRSTSRQSKSESRNQQ